MPRKIKITILAVITLVAYLSSLGNPFIWDDEQFITKNVYVQSFDVEKILTTNIDAGAGVKSNYYRPLTQLTFAIDNKIWGGNPFGFHLANLTLHILAGVLLFLFLDSFSIGTLFAFWVSMFFLVHPIQTEAVTYINSRGDSLYTALLFLSLYLFIHAIRKKKTKFFILSIISFFASILSKETAVTAILLFPGLLLIELLGTYFISKKSCHFLKNYSKTIYSVLVLTFGTIIYISLRLTVLNFANTLNFYNEQNIYTQNLLIRLYTFAKVLFIYIRLLVFPYPLHMERSVELITSFMSIYVLGAIILTALLLFVCVYEIKKRHTPFIFLGFLISTATLLPVSGIIPVNGMLYEHWLYVPMIGFFIIIFRLAQIFVIAIPRTFLTAFFSIIISIYTILTIRQNNIWSNPITFYTYTLKFGSSSRVENNLGISLSEIGDYKNAIKYYQKSLLVSKYPQTYNNLGYAYEQLGNFSEAEKKYLEALKISPDFIYPRANLVLLYLKTKQNEKARSASNNIPQILQIVNQYQDQN